MEYARSERWPAADDGFVAPAADGSWPFPRDRSRRGSSPELERAARDVLAATARAWGLDDRMPATPRAS